MQDVLAGGSHFQINQTPRAALPILDRRPAQKVLVLDGDGAVLMKMGTLATVGMLAPSSFHHVVFDNGTYESMGGQISASPHVDLAAMALACGYRDAATVSTEQALLGRPRLEPRDVRDRQRNGPGAKPVRQWSG